MVGAALERTGLARMADLPAGYCSAGQKRRAGLARALLSGRPVWLLDEPLAALDAEGRALMRGLIEGIWPRRHGSGCDARSDSRRRGPADVGEAR